ncbi:hypothetical protein NDU88_006113 [Pleurodeles waltl]|uniref:Uncharacterized protein n=1 Tax=Pleurodeles waltl TaxID=8319 RepID=A0AAV7NT93_PLEWA|nr:hypothetical protein NDU88_006113 [Pleurodeles waltl]
MLCWLRWNALDDSLERAHTSLEAKIDKVASDLVLLHADHRKLADKTGTIEARVDELTPVASRLESTVGDTLTRVAELERRVEDAEGRTRRNNIRVVGLPEGAEGRDAVAYSESWLRVLVPAGTLTPFFSVERAHRIPTRPRPPGSVPRPFIICLLHYADRDIILKTVRSSPPPRVGNAQIMRFPNYTLAVQKDRPLKQVEWEWLESTGRASGREVERNPPTSKSRRSRARRGRKGGGVTTEAATHAPDLEQLIQERREALQSAAALSASPPAAESETEISQPPSDRPATPDRLTELGFPECPSVTPATADKLF